MQNHKKVILLKVPGPWRFWDYGTPNVNLIEAWYQTLSDEAKFLFNDLLKNISKIENHLEWGIRSFLKGKYKNEGIWELGFVADGRQYRILGIFDGQKRVILLIGCYHKGHIYTPHDCLDTAHKRSKIHRAGKATLYERTIQTDF